jgi:hypothetical protein
MSPDEIILTGMSSNFQYEKISRALDSVDNKDILRDNAKLYAKLWIKATQVRRSI